MINLTKKQEKTITSKSGYKIKIISNKPTLSSIKNFSLALSAYLEKESDKNHVWRKNYYSAFAVQNLV
ncbi:hypothetical protein [Aeribacillus sp. FSL M8-0254]